MDFSSELLAPWHGSYFYDDVLSWGEDEWGKERKITRAMRQWRIKCLARDERKIGMKNSIRRFFESGENYFKIFKDVKFLNFIKMKHFEIN
jgi:hypothetical protein